MTQSPLREALEIFRSRKELSSVSPYSLGMADAIAVLESLLPKEKEFVGKVWNAGATSAFDNKRVHGTCEWDKEGHAANFIDFINQLYPEK